MSGFLGNQWVIGICTGLISGVITYPVTYLITYVLSGRHAAQERQRRVRQGNLQMVADFRLYTSTNGLPPPIIAHAIASSIARPLELGREDLLGVAEVWSDLLREAIASPYVSANQKKQFSLQFEELQQNEAERKEMASRDVQSRMMQAELKERKTSNQVMAFVASLFALLGTVISALVAFGDTSRNWTNPNLWWTILIVSVVATTATAVPASFINFRKSRSAYRTYETGSQTFPSGLTGLIESDSLRHVRYDDIRSASVKRSDNQDCILPTLAQNTSRDAAKSW